MTMPMMTAMNLLGALQTGAPNTEISHLGSLGSASLQTTPPLAGDCSQNGKEQTAFAEMLATAGVPSMPVVRPNGQATKAVESSVVPVAVETVKVQPMTVTVEPMHGLSEAIPRLKDYSQGVNATVDPPQAVPVGRAAKMRMPEPAIVEGEAKNSAPLLPQPVLAATVVSAKTSAASALMESMDLAVDAGTPAVAVDREGTTTPLIPAEVPPRAAAPQAVAADTPALVAVPKAPALGVASPAPVVALRPKAAVLTAVPGLPTSLADVVEAPAPVVSSAAPALAVAPSLPGPVAAPSAPALVVAREAPVMPTDVSEAPEVVEVKTVKVAKGWKTHSLEVPWQDSKAHAPEAAAQEKRASEIPVLAANEGVALTVPVVATVVQQVVASPVVHEAEVLVPAFGRIAGPFAAVGAAASRPTPAAAQPGNAPQEVSPIAGPRAEAGIAPALVAHEQVVVHEQVQAVPAQTAPPSIAVAKAIQRLAQGETKAAPQKLTHSGLAAIASSDTSAVAASPLLPVAPAAEAKHPSTQDAGATVIPHAVTAATPVVEAMRGVTTLEPHAASIVQSGLSAQPMESVVPTQPGLAHTTLNASPTVLEVGVPGGSHGWLKIRAELVEGGTVQASLVAASHAGHETLHRELPEMTAFLASEQLSVQLHVADRPQSSASSPQVEQDFAQTLAGGEGRGGERNERSHEEPGASPSSLTEDREIAWISSSYAPSTMLHGGSWVNVVA